MRLTVRLDDDLYRATKSKALAEQCSISRALNDLLRQTLKGPALESGKKRPARKSRRGIVVSKGERPFSSRDVELIDRLDDADPTA